MKIFNKNLLGLALAGLILGACSQTGTYETADLMNEQATAEKAGFKLTPFGFGNSNAMILDGGGDYQVDCITEESGDEFKAFGDLSATWGNNANNSGSKTLLVEVWNTLTTIEYRFTLSSSNENGNNLQYFNEGTAQWISAGALTVNVPLVISRPLPAGWVAGQEITEQWRQVGGGQALDAGDVTYALIGECSDCKESFDYDVNDDGTYTFTFIPGEDMTNALVEFTFAQGVAVSGLDQFSRNGSQADPKSSVWSATLSFDSCAEYSWTVDLTPDCSGNSGNSNVWTDFKVGGLSKKGTLSNITESCPS